MDDKRITDDKLVSLEAVKRALENAYYGEATLGELLETLDGISPVEQRMSAAEFLRAMKWLNYYAPDVYKKYSIHMMFGRYEEAAAVVEEWAKAHPEEVQNER